MTTPALRCEGLSAGYHGNAVLHDLTLSLDKGEMAALLGPNGAGKTTLLRAITGLTQPLSGTVQLFGQSLTSLSARERARLVAVVPQELTTPMAFTVQDVVFIGRTASLSRWRPPSAADRHSVDRALAYTDMVDMRRRPFTDLSGGEKQRAIVAMALAQEPRMILLDEATSHLDLNHRLELMQIVERLNADAGVTILMISHDLNLAAEYCRRLLLLDHGRLTADGAPTDVLTEDTLRRVYDCDVKIQKHAATGAVHVAPAPRLPSRLSGHGIRVLVLAGGGSGEDMMRRLSLCGYTVVCGPLNRGDSDADVAEALGIEVALEQPFSPLSESVLARSRALAETADAFIVCGVPFGPGNVAALSLARDALTSATPVFIMADVQSRDYTPQHEATARISGLVKDGAQEWTTPTELLSQLPAARDQEDNDTSRKQ